MSKTHLWDRSHELRIETGPDIVGGFSIGFDDRIPEETKDLLMHYVHWVEDYYHMPVTLWVDFEYKYYLRNRNGKPTGYRFYWADFTTYPVFTYEPDIPVIRLAVRREQRSINEILCAFTAAITHYFLWLANEMTEGYEPDKSIVEAIMDSYKAYCLETGHTF
jgi:hypothetical protein